MKEKRKKCIGEVLPAGGLAPEGKLLFWCLERKGMCLVEMSVVVMVREILEGEKGGKLEVEPGNDLGAILMGFRVCSNFG